MKGENNRDRWLHLRLTEAEHEKIREEYSRTTGSKLSDFARKKLLGDPITVQYRNQSLDGILEELARIRSELSAAGNNFNQAVKKLHTMENANQVHHWLLTYQSQQLQLLKQIEHVNRYIKILADIWSRE